MNRRGFISLLAGAAGAPLIASRLPEPIIVLAARRRVWTPTFDATPHHPLCNCALHVTPVKFDRDLFVQIVADEIRSPVDSPTDRGSA